LISKEGAFFFTLLLFILITLSILIGTLLPTLTNGHFSASPAWFNRVVGPQLAVLVLLMGVCPLFGRLFCSLRASLWLGIPSLVGLILVPVLAFTAGFTKLVPLIGFGFAGLAAGSIIGEISFDLFRSTHRKGGKKRGFHFHLTGRHGYGGFLVHLGMVLITIGVIGTQTYSWEKNISLTPGETTSVGGYVLIYEDLIQEVSGDHLVTRANIAAYRESTFLTTLHPQMAYYPTYQQTIAEPSVRAGIGEDLYLVLFQWEENGTIHLSVTINPLSVFLWAGALLQIVGGFLAWWPQHQQGTYKLFPQLGVLIGLIVIIALTFPMWGNTEISSNLRGRPLSGEKAPPFSASDVQGDVFALEDYQEKVVVINFWATWCPQCKDELPDFQSVWEEYQSAPVQFVGVAMDDKVKDVTEIAKKLEITYPLIVETEDVISFSYGITGVPETFIIDTTGQIAFIHIGAVDQQILREEIDILLKGE